MLIPVPRLLHTPTAAAAPAAIHATSWASTASAAVGIVGILPRIQVVMVAAVAPPARRPIRAVALQLLNRIRKTYPFKIGLPIL